MDYGRILQRAINITINYRSIWLYGILAAIFGQAGSQAPNTFQFTVPFRGPQSAEGFSAMLLAINPLVWIILGLVVLALFLIGIFVRLLSRAAIIGMVYDAETTGRTDVGKGFNYGINNFLRLLGIYLVIWIPFVLALLILLLIALSPLLLLLTGNDSARIFGVAVAVLLVLSVVALTIIAGIVLSVVQQFVDRNCVLRGMGVFDSIGAGFRIVRNHFGPAAMMWLIMFGVGLVIGMAIFALVAFLVAVVAIPAVLAWQTSSTLAVVIGVILGLPAFAVIVFVAALVDIFTTAAWTLAYLEIAKVGGQD